MTLQVLFRLFRKHAIWFILLPGITAGTIFWMTRNEPRLYKSQATLYTGLASGYSLQSVQQGGSVDRSAVAFDNLLATLNSAETQREIGTKLLIQHLHLQKPDSLVLGEAGFKRLQQIIPGNWRHLFGHQLDARIVAVVDSLSRTKADNPIKRLLQTGSYYSVASIGKKLKAIHKATNDMLDLEYESDDPAVAQHTLQLAMTILNKRYTYLKTSESNSVVDYYKNKSDQAKQQLDNAERQLQAFGVAHQVLNFEEESKNVATSREAVLNEYNQERMRVQAAKASIDALNQRMSQRGVLLSASNELRTKQAELTDAQNQLANAKVYGKAKAPVEQLQHRVDKISDDLKAIAFKYYAATNSADAIPQQTLVNEWLNKILAFEESAARLNIYKVRLSEYQAKTAEFSPLGSQLRQLNRNLSVAEKEFTTSKQSLDQALTHSRDIAIDGSLSVLDAPSFPLAPLPSKRWLFVAAGFGVGLFIALLLMAIRFWTDQRVNSPEKAEKMIGQPVVAAFPTVRKLSDDSAVGRTAMSIFKQLCSAINIEIVQTTNKPYPPIITVFSVHSGQGKTWISNRLANLYAEAGQRVVYCYPRTQIDEQLTDLHGVTFIPYTLRPDFMNAPTLEYLLNEESSYMINQYDKVILELPALVSNPIPIYLIKQSYISLLLTNADAKWGRNDRQLLAMYLKVATQSVLTVLNRVDEDYVHPLNRQEMMYHQKRLENPTTGSYPSVSNSLKD